MYSKSITNKKLKKDSSKSFICSDDCKVSKASKEIMLDRFCSGKVIEFPFSE